MFVSPPLLILQKENINLLYHRHREFTLANQQEYSYYLWKGQPLIPQYTATGKEHFVRKHKVLLAVSPTKKFRKKVAIKSF